MVAAVTGEVMIGGHKLKLGVRALMQLEARFGGKPVHVLFESPSITMVCAAIAAGTGLSEDQAADLIDRVGVGPASEAMAEAVQASFPDAVEGDASPQEAASTG